eukprot:2713473-Rhodomonas_salina.1
MCGHRAVLASQCLHGRTPCSAPAKIVSSALWTITCRETTQGTDYYGQKGSRRKCIPQRISAFCITT